MSQFGRLTDEERRKYRNAVQAAQEKEIRERAMDEAGQKRPPLENSMTELQGMTTADVMTERLGTAALNGNRAENADAERGAYVRAEMPERAEEDLPIGKKELDKAREILNKYRAGKALFDQRIVENEKWWRMRHLQYTSKHIQRETDTPSGWLFNTLANKHADAMDNYPTLSVLPREASDRQDAETLGSVIPVILEQCDFESTYDEAWQYKLKSGTAVYGVFWDTRKQNGLGDVDIRRVDVLNLYWEPRISKLQESKNLFYVYLEDDETLEAMYPQLKGKVGGKDFSTVEYAYEDAADETGKSTVIDWYYKKYVNGRTVLHFCKFCGDTVLASTENDESTRDRGLYDHGEYPFVMDIMYRIEGSPAGFGYVDVMKGVMTRIDRLQNAITENAMEAVNTRWFIRDSASINEEEFEDHSNKLVHVAGEVSDANVKMIEAPSISGNYITILNNYIQELKEVSGNRDANSGGAAGVTAASAIAALQEAGSKISRDVIKGSYRAFQKICYLIIENIRQFYTERRTFRVIGDDGEQKFVELSNARLAPRGDDLYGIESSRKPVFDVVVRAQKQSQYSKMSQNELAKEFFGMGFFNPQNADIALATLGMMDFDGKAEVMRNIEKNGTMYTRFMALQQQTAKLAQIVDRDHGSHILESMVQERLIDGGFAQQAAGPQPMVPGRQVQTDTMGNLKEEPKLVENARARVQEGASPR